MLNKIKTLIDSIEDAKILEDVQIAEDLLETLITGNKTEIGKFMLDLRNEGYDFGFERQDLKDPAQCVDIVKNTDNRAEKVYYALAFVGLKHKVTAKTVKKLLKENIHA